MNRIAVLVVAAALSLIALAGCTSEEPVQATPTPSRPASSSVVGAPGGITFAVITHGGPNDAFWNVVKEGAEAAGRQYGVGVQYKGDSVPAGQSRLIDQAVAQKVDGIVVSLANPDALRPSIARAVNAGIPLITINSGADRFREFGAITHVGQSEDVAGRGAGEKLRDDGVTRLLCVIHEANNVGLQQRCTGAAEGLGASVERLMVDVNNLTDASAKIEARLQADTALNGVLTLNPAIAIAAREAIDRGGFRAKLATFDLSDKVVTAIKDGQIVFAVDQQQYLQGWLPITFLALYKYNLNTVGGGLPVNTGPGFVTKENVEQVADFANRGTR